MYSNVRVLPSWFVSLVLRPKASYAAVTVVASAKVVFTRLPAASYSYLVSRFAERSTVPSALWKRLVRSIATRPWASYSVSERGRTVWPWITAGVPMTAVLRPRSSYS